MLVAGPSVSGLPVSCSLTIAASSRCSVAFPYTLARARAEFNKLRNGWVAGGHKGLQRAINELFKTPIFGTSIMAVFYPEMVKEVIEDEVAKGMTKEDLEELIRKLESPKRKQ